MGYRSTLILKTTSEVLDTILPVLNQDLLNWEPDDGPDPGVAVAYCKSARSVVEYEVAPASRLVPEAKLRIVVLGEAWDDIWVAQCQNGKVHFFAVDPFDLFFLVQQGHCHEV